MDEETEKRRKRFVGACGADPRVARTAIDRLLEFSSRPSSGVTLDLREHEQTSIGFQFVSKPDTGLWKAYAKDRKVEIMTHWSKTLSQTDQGLFLAKWKLITGRELPRTGKGSFPTLSFEAFENDTRWRKIEDCLDWLCQLH